MDEPPGISETLKNLQEKADNGYKKITLGRLIHLMKDEGFAALLLIPTVIVLLPTGGIPGVPLVCSILIFLIAVQMAWGREEIWIPRGLKKIKFSRPYVIKGIDGVQPIAEKIDTVTQPRLALFLTRTAQRLAALVCIALCIPMAVIGFIPFFPMLFTIPILFLALGLLVEDGLLILGGFISAGGVICSLPFIVSWWV